MYKWVTGEKHIKTLDQKSHISIAHLVLAFWLFVGLISAISVGWFIGLFMYWY